MFVTSSFPRWHGDSTTPFVLNLAKDLQCLGWQVDVLAPHADGAATVEDLAGVHVERFRYLWPPSLQTVCYGGGALINLRRNRWNYAKLPALVCSEMVAVLHRLRRQPYDLIHSHWILPQGLVAGIAGRLLGIPHVTTVHGGDAFALSGGVLASFKRMALGLSQTVTVNSSATMAAVSEIVPDHPAVVKVPMGIDVSAVVDQSLAERLRATYRRGDGPLLLFVGRVLHEKGVGELLEAVSLLRRDCPSVTALVVGDGQDREDFQRRSTSLGISDRVHFTGWVDSAQVPAYFAAADAFIGASKRSPQGWQEGQGLTFLEAMSVGTPVIATACGGIADAVHDGQSGLLVPEGSPIEIATAVRRLVEDSELRARIIDGGRQVAGGQYSRATCAEAISGIYGGLVSPTRIDPTVHT